jgi:uncharacterized protein
MISMQPASLRAACFVGLLSIALSACNKQSPPPTEVTPTLSDQQIKTMESMAESGNPVAKYQLGKKYRDGDTVPQNPTNSVVWFRKAADAGYAKAQYHLGLAYEEGKGAGRDLAEAARWYTKAAEQGNSNAQEKLGFAFWKGAGVATNLVEAHKWLTLAAANGEGKAAKGLKRLELSMAPQQLAEAKKLAAAFTPKKVYKEPKEK